MSGHRRRFTRDNLLRQSRVSFVDSVGFLEPLALEWYPTKYAVAPIPGFTSPHEVDHLKPAPGKSDEGLNASLITSDDEHETRDGGEQVQRITFRQKLYHTLNGKVDSPVEYFVLLLILTNVIMFMAGTVWVDRQTGEISCVTLENEDESKCIQLNDKYPGFFDSFEIFSMGVFTIEYLVRLYVCVEDPQYSQYHWFVARIWWVLSLVALIDLLAILPTWVEVMVPAFNCPGFGILRICRLGRLIKAQDYIDAYSVLRDVATQNSALLVVSCWYGFIALVLFSSILYYTEKNWDGDSGVVFASIPKGMFATALFLSGEFTLDELSPAGEFFALVACLGTIGMITIPVSVLAAGFIEKIQDENFRKEYLMHKRQSMAFAHQHGYSMSRRHGSIVTSAYTPKGENKREASRKSTGNMDRQFGVSEPKSDGIEPSYHVQALNQEIFAQLEEKLESLQTLESKLENIGTLETKVDALLTRIERAIPIE